jgi:hypothetical protein
MECLQSAPGNPPKKAHIGALFPFMNDISIKTSKVPETTGYFSFLN